MGRRGTPIWQHLTVSGSDSTTVVTSELMGDFLIKTNEDIIMINSYPLIESTSSTVLMNAKVLLLFLHLSVCPYSFLIRLLDQENTENQRFLNMLSIFRNIYIYE